MIGIGHAATFADFIGIAPTSSSSPRRDTAALRARGVKPQVPTQFNAKHTATSWCAPAAHRAHFAPARRRRMAFKVCSSPGCFGGQDGMSEPHGSQSLLIVVHGGTTMPVLARHLGRGHVAATGGGRPKSAQYLLLTVASRQQVRRRRGKSPTVDFAQPANSATPPLADLSKHAKIARPWRCGSAFLKVAFC